MKNNFFNFLSAFSIAYGITALDLDNLKIADNYKAYILILLGILILIISYRNSKQK
ncbi:MAG: hypothetical protein KYX68_13845 [Flavobacterium sp.]|nr:hypothetical protein [Flavobacterium sp.]